MGFLPGADIQGPPTLPGPRLPSLDTLGFRVL